MTSKVMHLVFCFIIDQTNNWMMTSNNNVSSAIVHVLNSNSMVSIIQHVSTQVPGRVLMQGEAEDRAERNESRKRQRVKAVEPAAVSPIKAKAVVKAKTGTCHLFNNSGACDKVDCKFKHACEKCGATAHGSNTCVI